jgi:hypothetical protein
LSQGLLVAQDKFFYQKQEVRDFAAEILEEMTIYTRHRFKIPDFDPLMTISFHPSHYIPHGGHNQREPILFIPVYRLLKIVNRKGKTRKFIEYDQFKDDPDIGELKKACWKQWIACTIAHELAHAIQYYAITHPRICADLLKKYSYSQAEEHGAMWQDIYRGFRIRYVNNFVF